MIKWFISVFIILLSYSNASAQVADSPWAMYMGDLRHTGRSKYSTSIEKPQLKWKFDAGNGIETSAIIAHDGTIYFGTFKNNFIALNPDGTEKWRFTKEGEEFRSTPTIAKDGTIYFGAIYDFAKVYNDIDHQEMEYGRPKVYALSPDGTEKWHFETGGIMGGTYASPTIGPDGTIYMGAGGAKMTDRAVGGSKVWAINPDGTAKWSFDTGEAIFTAVAIADDGTIYVACANNNLYALNSDGSEKWRFTRKTSDFSVFDGTPAIADDGTIYVANTDKTLYAITPEGEEKWNFKVDDIPFEATPTIAKDGTIYFGVIDRSEKDKNVYALNPDGTLKWKFETGSGVIGSPVIDNNGILFFGSYDKNLYSLSPEGKELWRYPIGGGIVVTPTISPDGTIYVGSWDNHLYAIGGGENKEKVVGSLKDAKSNPTAKTTAKTTFMIISIVLFTVSMLVALLLVKKHYRISFTRDWARNNKKMFLIFSFISIFFVAGASAMTVPIVNKLKPQPQKIIETASKPKKIATTIPVKPQEQPKTEEKKEEPKATTETKKVAPKKTENQSPESSGADSSSNQSPESSGSNDDSSSSSPDNSNNQSSDSSSDNSSGSSSGSSGSSNPTPNKKSSAKDTPASTIFGNFSATSVESIVGALQSVLDDATGDYAEPGGGAPPSGVYDYAPIDQDNWYMGVKDGRLYIKLTLGGTIPSSQQTDNGEKIKSVVYNVGIDNDSDQGDNCGGSETHLQINIEYHDDGQIWYNTWFNANCLSGSGEHDSSYEKTGSGTAHTYNSGIGKNSIVWSYALSDLANTVTVGTTLNMQLSSEAEGATYHHHSYDQNYSGGSGAWHEWTVAEI